ncbi:MAG: prepilin-type N-terminal cleavage/methylation domain-containing protein [Fimbriimonadaceae bacterium]|nr:prepilin-type N-terminal cleavage/methylation domain-containing protein [Fimbriimonadaceae bacterium]QYK55878.1 MAG: prepilin-type N-terminal cleavage/methylation domain-containing protein [Fimbriimonadaceae bacterium]
MRKALSFVEVLVVIALLAVLVAIIYPVFGNSRRGARETNCVSNLRQLYAAWALYVDANEGRLPSNMAQFVGESAKPVALCPSDPLGGANTESSKALQSPVSYFYVPTQDYFLNAIAAADPNHGILVDLMHGERKKVVKDPFLDTKGLVFRGLLDGSVHRARVDHMCLNTARGEVVARPHWTIFTDALPCPEPWCLAGSTPCSR